MAVPTFLNGSFRYFTRAGVTDVQTIIDDLYAELVTGLGWSCTAGGVGNANTTYKTPVGAYGPNEFFTLNLQRIAATNLQIIMMDGYGLQVNNETHNHLFIDAGGTDVFLYSGINKPYCVIDSERVSPETWWCCQVERHPDVTSRPVWLCSEAPRDAAEALTFDEWAYAHWMDHVGGNTAYTTGANGFQWFNNHKLVTTGTAYPFKTQSGALMFAPIEYSIQSTYYGKIPQALIIDSGQAFKSDAVVPIDTGVTGTFRVTGGPSYQGQRMCWRKA